MSDCRPSPVTPPATRGGAGVPRRGWQRLEIAALAPMIEEMEAIEMANLDEYEPDRASADTYDDQFDWLLNTERDYWDQLAAFKQYINGAGL